jgi:hypothetical protein
MTENAIVDEVHRIREQMLEEFSGDLGALMKDAQRRTEDAARAGGEVVADAPHETRPAPAKKVG